MPAWAVWMRIRRGLPKILAGSFKTGIEATGKNKTGEFVECWDCFRDLVRVIGSFP